MVKYDGYSINQFSFYRLFDIICLIYTIMRHLKLFESFMTLVEIDDKRLYRRLSLDEMFILRHLIEMGDIKTESPTQTEIKKLREFNLNIGSVDGVGVRVIKLSDDYWLAINHGYYYLCDTIDGLINCPITK